MTITVTNSELKTFKRCRRQWYLGYFRKLEKKDKPTGGPLRTGTILHECMETYYKTGSADEALKHLDKMRAEEPKLLGEYESPDIAKMYDLVSAMVEGYLEHLEETGMDADFETVATEIKLETASPVEGVNLMGKIDLLVKEISTERMFVRDHKSTMDLTSPTKTLHLDRQMKLYMLMLKILHPDMAANDIEWNMLKKSKRTARAKPPFYARHEIHHSDAALRRFWVQIGGEIEELMRLRGRLTDGEDHQKVAYPTPTQDCYWDCPFYSVCGHLDDPDYPAEEFISDNFKVYNPLERYNEAVDGEIPES